jgi:hypothetical protein
LEEKTVVLDMAKRVRRILRERGNVIVHLTRESDRFLSLEERTQFANARGADLFVSIHANAAPTSGASGVETFYLDNTTDRAAIRLAAFENRTAPKKMSDLQMILRDLEQTAKVMESHALALRVHRSLLDGLQIDDESTQLVTDGVLAQWDTRGLNGLYALQLLVVRSDQRVERAVVQVTIDNEAPQVTLMDDANPARAGQTQVFMAQATDNLGLAEVRFWIDGTPQAVLQSAPYVFAWQARLGKHTLKIEAVDFAGNSTIWETVFDVIR